MSSQHKEKIFGIHSDAYIGGVLGLLTGFIAGYFLNEGKTELITAKDAFIFGLSIINLILTTAGGATVGVKLLKNVNI